MPNSRGRQPLEELLVRNWHHRESTELAACLESAEHVLAHVRQVVSRQSAIESSRELETLFRRAFQETELEEGSDGASD